MYLSILDKKQRLVLYFFVCPLLIIGLVLETIGIGLIIPVVDFVLSDKSIFIISAGPINIELETSKISILVSFLSLYSFKTFFLISQNIFLHSYFYKIYYLVSSKLFSHYLEKDFQRILGEKSEYYKTLILSESMTYSQSFLQPLIMIVSDVLLIVFLTTILLLNISSEFWELGLVFSIFLGVYFYLGQRISKRVGKARRGFDVQRYRLTDLAFGSIKELKIYNLSQFFIDQFKKASIGSAKSGRTQTVLQTMPKLVFELVAVCFIVTYFLTRLFQDGEITDYKSVLAKLVLLAAVGLKILPAIARLTSNSQSVSYSLPIVFEINSINKTNAEVSIAKRRLPLTEGDLTNRFHETRQHKIIVTTKSSKILKKGRQFSFSTGSMSAVLGPSGSGKTTLLNYIAGLDGFDEAVLEFDKIKINKSDAEEWHQKISFVSQEIFVFEGSVRDNLNIIRPENKFKDEKLIQTLIQLELAKDFFEGKDLLDYQVGELGAKLSGGQRQRLAIGRALLRDTEIFILDEPFSSLDGNNTKNILKLFHKMKKQKIIIIVTHDENNLNFFDKIIKMN